VTLKVHKCISKSSGTKINNRFLRHHYNVNDASFPGERILKKIILLILFLSSNFSSANNQLSLINIKKVTQTFDSDMKAKVVDALLNEPRFIEGGFIDLKRSVKSLNTILDLVDSHDESKISILERVYGKVLVNSIVNL